MAHVAPVAQGALTAGASLASPDAPGCGQLHVLQQLLPPQSWPRPQEGGDSAAAVAAVTAAAVMAAAVEERTSGVWVTPGWCPRTISLDASLQEVHALKLNGAEDARDVSSENGGTENLCREGFGSGSHAEASWAAGMFPCGSMEPPSLVAPCCWVGPCILIAQPVVNTLEVLGLGTFQLAVTRREVIALQEPQAVSLPVEHWENALLRGVRALLAPLAPLVSLVPLALPHLVALEVHPPKGWIQTARPMQSWALWPVDDHLEQLLSLQQCVPHQ